MNVLALCSGVLGLELGIRLAEPTARVVCYVEREAYPIAVTRARIQDGLADDAPVWDDLTTFNGRPWRGTVDCIAAGFPCQPFSAAGQRRGPEDARWLWPDIARIVRDVGPRYVFLENVPGLLRGGADAVFGSLAELGYRWAWGSFRASDVGAPHRRERVFILAQSEEFRGRQGSTLPAGRQGAGSRSEELADAQHHRPSPGPCHGSEEGKATPRGGDVADPDRRQQAGRPAECEEAPSGRPYGQPGGPSGGLLADPESEQVGACGFTWEGAAFPPSPADLNAWAAVLDADPSLEPAVRSVAPRLSTRVDELAALGNAVVPAVAALAWRTLKERLDEA